MDRDYSKITSADAPWLKEPSARAVCDAIMKGGHQIYFVGGCVRNALLGAPVSDVDMSTSATPDETMTLAQDAGLKPVPTGIDHGTITVVSDGIGYEVTTFRRDAETDGRRAVVVFSSDILDDARRRDFTMNALYADPEGNIVDPLGGMADVRARRVRFIEDADQRIREDYLRTLRFFRFHAWYARPDEGMDEDALAAIAENIDGLEKLSAERVGAEVRKLLEAPDPSTALASMARTGVLNAVLPGSDPRYTQVMVHGARVVGIAPDWLGRLVALGGLEVPERLRLSKAQQRMYQAIKTAAFDDVNLLQVANEQDEGIALQAHLIRSAVAEGLPDPALIERLKHAAAQKFPVTARDLMPAYVGPDIGARLAQLKAAWITSGFTLKKAELLALPAL
jgi:poly(A) polymerase/tRNA nucleotidyltransferase (CCA-adding enzyme)